VERGFSKPCLFFYTSIPCLVEGYRRRQKSGPPLSGGACYGFHIDGDCIVGILPKVIIKGVMNYVSLCKKG
jgi:hypothetical protein